MKKVMGGNFSVRFARRGLSKPTPQKEEARAIILEQIAKAKEGLPDILTPMPVEKVSSIKPTLKPGPNTEMMEAMLRAAAFYGDCQMVRTLVMRGVDLEARDSAGRTAFHIATQYCNHDVIKTLLAAREMRRMARLGDLPDTKFYRRFKQDIRDESR